MKLEPSEVVALLQYHRDQWAKAGSDDPSATVVMLAIDRYIADVTNDLVGKSLSQLKSKISELNSEND